MSSACRALPSMAAPAAISFQEWMDVLPAAQILVDERGTVLHSTPAFDRHLGTTVDAGDSLLRWIQAESQTMSLTDLLEQVALTGKEVSVAVWIRPSQQLQELGIYRLDRARTPGHPDSEHEWFWCLLSDATRVKLSEQQLKRTERLASVGELSANLAHELNSPIDGALRYLQFLLEDLAEGDSRRKYALYVQNGLLRMARIVKGLLYFSRQNAQCIEPIDIHRSLDEALTFFEHDLEKHRIQVEKSFSLDIPILLCRDLENVFLNVIKNAIQAMPDGGKLSLRSYLSQEGERSLVGIEISDTGHGIPWEMQSQVFAPFFTTKDVGEGTGLGLSISRGIVERYHGSIQVHSCLHQGTTIAIQIPVESGE